MPPESPNSAVASESSQAPGPQDTVMDIEILEFQVPTENNKTLLVLDIEAVLTKSQVYVSPLGSGLHEARRSSSNLSVCVLSFRRSSTAVSPALVLSTFWRCALMLLRTHLGSTPSSSSTRLFRHQRLSVTLMDGRSSRRHPSRWSSSPPFSSSCLKTTTVDMWSCMDTQVRTFLQPPVTACLIQDWSW